MPVKKVSFVDDNVFSGGNTEFYRAERKWTDLVHIMSQPVEFLQHWSKRSGFTRCLGEDCD